MRPACPPRPPPSAANSLRHRPPISRPAGARPDLRSFRQAGQAQAGDEEFENFGCLEVSVRAKAGDGQLGVYGKQSTEFGARRVEPAEMGIGGDFDPHRCDYARLVVQGAVGPFDRLFEAPRNEMSDRSTKGV